MKVTSFETNRYGQVDIQGSVPPELIHIEASVYHHLPIRRICETLSCECAPALVDFRKTAAGKWQPITDGVVIRKEFCPAVLAEIKSQLETNPLMEAMMSSGLKDA